MIIDQFDAGVAKHPQRVCVQSDAVRMTYVEVADASHALAHALAERGLARAHIGILCPNDPVGYVTMLGIVRAGAAYVPLNARDAIEDLIWFMAFVELSALVVDRRFLPEVERIRGGVPTLREVIVLDGEGGGLPSVTAWMREHAGARVETRGDLDDIALIKSSGGTTGRPKAIMQSHRALHALYRASNRFCPPAKEPVHLVVAPLTHAAGATAIGLSPFGTRNVIAPSADPAVVLALIERERVTHVFLPPTMIYRLLAHPDARTRDCSSLEYLIYGAAPMSVDKLREGLALWGPVFMQIYGQAEVPGMITCLSRHDHDIRGNPSDTRHLASAGRPTGACEVALMDDDGRFVDVGERGEIVARGELVTPGYFNNPEATAEARAHGWHHTGDIGVFDGNGFLYIVDRKKDMIISGGFNVYPSEIEQLIWSHPAVQDCAVVGVPDADWGERVTAIVELKPGSTASADEIIALCRARLGGTKAPKHVEFWPTLPRSPVGKVLKKDVRTVLADAKNSAAKP
ncbi:MAG TPA: AMP-binding protein [Burkholderiaceae bacterium]|nr:AMP-binding protein [Burkholderiaceae bacterium]